MSYALRVLAQARKELSEVRGSIETLEMELENLRQEEIEISEFISTLEPEPHLSTREKMLKYMTGKDSVNYRTMAEELGIKHGTVAATLSQRKDLFSRTETSGYWKLR